MSQRTIDDAIKSIPGSTRVSVTEWDDGYTAYVSVIYPTDDGSSSEIEVDGPGDVYATPSEAIIAICDYANKVLASRRGEQVVFE